MQLLMNLFKLGCGLKILTSLAYFQQGNVKESK